jgi:hypothetical protein
VVENMGQDFGILPDRRWDRFVSAQRGTSLFSDPRVLFSLHHVDKTKHQQDAES